MNFERITIGHVELVAISIQVIVSLVVFGSASFSITYRIRAVLISDTLAIEQEPHRSAVLARTFAESVHEFFKLCRAFDFEEYFVVVVCDFDVQVLRLLCLVWLWVWRAAVVGHCDVGQSKALVRGYLVKPLADCLLYVKLTFKQDRCC